MKKRSVFRKMAASALSVAMIFTGMHFSFCCVAAAEGEPVQCRQEKNR